MDDPAVVTGFVSAPSSRFPGLLNHPLSGLLYHLLTTEFGLELDRADERVEAVPATEFQAELLDVLLASAFLEIWRLAWDVQGKPVE